MFLHFCKILLLSYFVFINNIKFGLWLYRDLRMSQVLGILRSTLGYLSKIKKEALLRVFPSQIPLQFLFLDLPFCHRLFYIEGDWFSKMAQNHVALEFDISSKIPQI